jgi:hypothetical protein
MKLQFLAISDTHLGEDTSLLGFPHGLQRLWEALRCAFGGGRPGGHGDPGDPGDPVYVEELVLLGDIPDRTLSSTAQITTCTNAFMDTLASALDVRRVVYVPGNHDHTVWTELRAPHSLPLITPPEGIRIFQSRGRGKDGPVMDLAAAELLAVFFGYPHGAAWNRVVQKWPIDFHVANPVYARRFAGRTYVFTHGTHFRSDVLLPGWVKLLVDRLQLDALLGALDLNTSGLDPHEADDLLDLEGRITPFVESLWPSSKDRPTSRADELWYLLMTLSARFGKHLPPPPAPYVLYSREQILRERPARVRDLIPALGMQHPAIQRLREGFWRHLLRYLDAHDIESDDITLIFGDTHDGGTGELVTTSRRARLYNTGGWVVHNQLEHPPTQLFAVDEAGTEYVLDVGFRGVRLSPDDERTEIISLAAEDAEHRASTTSAIVRAVLDTFPLRP